MKAAELLAAHHGSTPPMTKAGWTTVAQMVGKGKGMGDPFSSESDSYMSDDSDSNEEYARYCFEEGFWKGKGKQF